MIILLIGQANCISQQVAFCCGVHFKTIRFFEIHFSFSENISAFWDLTEAISVEKHKRLTDIVCK